MLSRIKHVLRRIADVFCLVADAVLEFVKVATPTVRALPAQYGVAASTFVATVGVIANFAKLFAGLLRGLAQVAEHYESANRDSRPFALVYA